MVTSPETVKVLNVPTLVKEEDVTVDPNVVLDNTSALLILYTAPDFRLRPVESSVALLSMSLPLRVLNANEPTSDPSPTFVKVPSMVAIDFVAPAAFSDSNVKPTPIPGLDVPDAVRVSVNRFSTVFPELNVFSTLNVVALTFPCAEYITALELTTVPGTAVFNKFKERESL